MTLDLEVRELEPVEIVSASAMLARAFWDSALMQILAPDPARRAEISRWFFDAQACYGLLYGDVWAAVDPNGVVRGAAIWWAPEVVEPDGERSSESGLADGPLVVGPDNWGRLQELSRTTLQLHEQVAADPHWYLSILGVDPELQGQGIGGDVLQPVLDYLDEEGVPAFLETALERNLGLYRQHGFEVRAEATLPSVGMTVWAMRREPR